VVVVVLVAFGSMEDVFDAICTGSAEGCRAPVMVEGGKRVKKRRSLGCRFCARLMCACIEAIVAVCWCVYGYTLVLLDDLTGTSTSMFARESRSRREQPTSAPTARVRAAASSVWRELPPPPNRNTQQHHHINYQPLPQPTTTSSETTTKYAIITSAKTSATLPIVLVDIGNSIQPDTTSPRSTWAHLSP
jgi:hypothetical protein